MKPIIRSWGCKDSNCDKEKNRNKKHYHAQYFCVNKETNQLEGIGDKELFWDNGSMNRFCGEAAKHGITWEKEQI